MNESLEARVARLERAAGGYDDPRIQAEIERLDAEIQAIIEKNAAARGLSVDEYLAAHPLGEAEHVCAGDGIPEPPQADDCNIAVAKSDAPVDKSGPQPARPEADPARLPRPPAVSLLRPEPDSWQRLGW